MAVPTDESASLTTEDLFAVHFLDTLRGTAVGTHGSLSAIDGGETWSRGEWNHFNLNEVFY
jgi:photosystem II stability/assembly factor-like uncharacterized protein